MLLYTYPHALRPCHFVKRYKRFFVDVFMPSGAIETVHCANSGSMKSCLVENAVAYTLDSFNEKRKLRHSLELLQLEDGLACLNTARANGFIESLLLSTLAKSESPYFSQAHFPYEKFNAYQIVKREAKFNAQTRFDFCLTSLTHNKKCWIEVKSVSLQLGEGEYAFPDAVTERGQKHLRELIHAKSTGDDAWLFFVVMRGSHVDPKTLAKNFRACHEIDPKYAALLELAKKSGVNIAVVVPDISVAGFGLRGFFQY